MKTVYKYPLTEPLETLHLPRSSRIVNVATQDGNPTLWIEQWTELPTVRRTFLSFGTGHAIPEEATYVGTAHDVSGAGLVFHVYEVDA